ncbi:flagellar hook protein FliD [Desulfitobacterium hafniense]|uniref:Flagellar hook-associated protein 2 n=1 Tax=Desulfitobacterium hafniense TaxID=49338 RepID=A0A0W1JKE9_DESHA|nr:flagellar filament capping protein FliD [Desulfitobacterium hafniense]KTE92002.1 flagellar hook protein FliD [Desulfitobacterium hafniense]
MAIRTYGLSGSGMDVDQLVKDMMTARREQYDKVWQKKTQLEWKKTDYNTMYTAIQDFRNTTAFNYRLSGTTSPKIVTSSAEDIVTATANSDAANVSRSIKVTQLAEGAKTTSTATISQEGAGKESLSSQLDMAEGTFELVISDGTESKTIQVDTTKSIYDFVSDLNKSGLKIKASYDAALDRFNISTAGTGANVAIDFSQTTDSEESGAISGREFITEKLKLDIDNTTMKATGQDAIVKIDDMELTQANNTFSAFGVTYNLKAEGTAKINIAADNEKAVSVVKDFIEKYNSFMEGISKELSEAKYKNYMPLTDEMKSQLSDSQITQWESMAKSGLLRNDSTLQTLLNKLRTDVALPISDLGGKYNSLSSIGVTTGDYTEGSKLYLNEEKLREALEADSDVVNKLFGSTGEDRNAQGVAVRFYDTLKLTMDSIKDTAGLTGTLDGDTKSTLAKQIKNYENELDVMNDRLTQMEERYYKQYNAMEVALNKLSQQSSWLANMFSGGN